TSASSCSSPTTSRCSAPCCGRASRWARCWACWSSGPPGCSSGSTCAGPTATTTRRCARCAGSPEVPAGIGTPHPVAIAFFFLFIAVTLGITWWAARRTRTAEHFYAAGRTVTAFQNGLALAGDYMSAASFLGIAGLVATSGFDGLIYSIGFLVGWPIVTFLIAEPLRNLGRYTFADVVALRLRQVP